MVVARNEERRDGELLFNGYRGSFWRWAVAMVVHHCLVNVFKCPELYILKWIKWCILFLCIFYHNKNKHHITIFVFSESVQDADYVVF